MPTAVRTETAQKPLSQAERVDAANKLIGKFIDVLLGNRDLGDILANIYLGGLEKLGDVEQSPIGFKHKGQLVQVQHTQDRFRRRLEVFRYDDSKKPLSIESAVIESTSDVQDNPDGYLHYHKQTIKTPSSKVDLFNNSTEAVDKLTAFIDSF